MEMYDAKSKFMQSYLELVKKIQIKFDLSEIEAKEVCFIVSEFLHKNESSSD